MTINLSNYEAWFLDYHEGNLDENGRKTLFLFLEAHPALKEEFESFEMLSLESPDLSYPGKEKLRKAEVDDKVLTSRFIAYHEGDLSMEEKQQVDAFLVEQPAYREEFETCRKLKLLPDYTVIFESKSSLKHRIIVPFRPAYRYAAAAVLVLLFLTYFIFREAKAPQIIVQDANLVPKEQKQPLAGMPPKSHALPGKEQSKGTTPSIVAPVHSIVVRRQVAGSSPQVLRKDSAAAIEKLPSLSPSLEEGQQLAAATPLPVQVESKRDRLSEIFSEEDMKDLGLAEETKAPKNKLWNLLEKGANGVNKITGSEIAASRQEEEEREQYTFAIGNFSVSHSRSK